MFLTFTFFGNAIGTVRYNTTNHELSDKYDENQKKKEIEEINSSGE